VPNHYGKYRVGPLLSVSLLVGGLTFFHAARSDDFTSAKADSLEEIVVTARYKTENVQETPIAITSLSSDALEQRGFTNVLQVADVAPNVTLQAGQASGSGGGKSAVAFIRGVGQSDFDPAFEPGVGFYLDDVYQGSLFGSLFSLGDIDHVDVLRGPQGTLFGKNNEGGAIRVYTKQPTGDDSGYLDVAYGNYHEERIKGALDVSLVPDQLFLRISGGSDHRDGYINIVNYACAFPALAGTVKPSTGGGCTTGTEGGLDVREAHATLRYVPSSRLDVSLSADVTDDTSGPAAQQLLALNLTPGSGLANYNRYVAIPTYGIPLDNRFLVGGTDTTYSNFCETSTARCVPRENTIYSNGLANTVIWNAPWDLRVKNILGYRRDAGEYGGSDSGSPVPVTLLDNISEHHQFTEELNVSGTTLHDTFEWTGGLYYYESHYVYSGTALLPGLQIVGPGILPFAPNGAYGLDFNFNDPVNSHSKSAFLHGLYHVTEKLGLETGFRYSKDDKTYTFTRDELALTPPNPLFPGGTPIPGFANHPSDTSTDSRPDYKAALQYQWTDSTMTYLQVATGYKAGGINPRPVFASNIAPFGVEKLLAYEFGEKTEFFDRRLRINTAIFYSNYTDLQLTTFNPDGSTQIENAGKVHIYGLETELLARPFKAFQVDASLSYLGYDIVNLGAAAGIAGMTVEDQAANVPKWKGTVGAQYDINIGNAGIVTPRIDWRYQAYFFSDPQNTPQGRVPSYGLTNVRIGWQPAAGKWSAALESANVFNKKYYINETVDYDSYGYVTGQPGMPRTILVSLRYKF
jgi:iron complex outermembrane receptor protein